MTKRYRLPVFANTINLPTYGRKDAAPDGWFYPRDATEQAELRAAGCDESDLDIPDAGTVDYKLSLDQMKAVQAAYTLGGGSIGGALTAAITDNVYPCEPGISRDLLVTSTGAAYVELDIPTTGQGSCNVISLSGNTLALSVNHKLQGFRLANTGSSIVCPSTTFDFGTGTEWTFMVIVRVPPDQVNQQSGTTSHAFARAGASSIELGYEGPNASNPGCIKFLARNAANNGQVSVRSNSSPTPAFAAFNPSNYGNYVAIIVRARGAAGTTENMLSPTLGTSVPVTIAAESVTLAWGNLQASDPSTVQLYGGSVNFAKSAASNTTAAVNLTPGTANTGANDIVKAAFINKWLTTTELNKMLTGKRPQDCGVTGLVDATDWYFDLDSLTAANIIDQIGGGAITSITLAGGDAATPSVDRAKTRQYVTSFSSNKLVAFMDGHAKGI